MRDTREKIVSFGPKSGLVGVLSEPDTLRPNAPFVITSNVGMHNRAGPYRLYVELARRLAAVGFPMLRFDLSGMGDSPARADGVDELDRALLDMNDAMSMLAERHGAQRFVPMGLCSGVDSTHAITVADPRVAAAVFIEGYSFRTPEFYVRRYLERPLKRRFWEVYLRRKLRAYLQAGRSNLQEAAAEPESIYARAYPSREQLQAEYAALLARDVRLLFAFSGGFGSDYGYNYAGQFADTFPALGRDRRVDIVFNPKADHIYSVLEHRAQLISQITTWLCSHFPEQRP